MDLDEGIDRKAPMATRNADRTSHSLREGIGPWFFHERDLCNEQSEDRFTIYIADGLAGWLLCGFGAAIFLPEYRDGLSSIPVG
jgi:hypothetical protein